MQRVGPYELRGELGRGAMAIVWRAFDTTLEREVALKEPTIPPGADEAAAAEFAARFVREGKAAARLNHPGIITIHAAGIYDGRPAIVMELVEGETLAAILERGPLECASAVAILDQLLDAIAYAHSRGVIHRDIKPDNVFITQDGRVKLADFGIARMGTDATITQAGTVMGTPGYMAPEQVTGQPADERADIFAVGTIAYELLTGRNPFGATTGTATTTVMYRIVHENPNPLPDTIPESLSAAIYAALAKEPARRHAGAAEMRAALRGLDAGRSQSVASPRALAVTTPRVVRRLLLAVTAALGPEQEDLSCAIDQEVLDAATDAVSGRAVASIGPRCPSCATPYDPGDYRNDAEAWVCPGCGMDLKLALGDVDA